MIQEDAHEFPHVPYPWQQSQWLRLRQQQVANKLPHALMLAGQKGIGKLHMAKALSQLLLCQSPQADLPCGHCRTCELNKAGSHPDAILVEPESEGKMIKVDQIRKLTEFVAKTSQQGGMKTVIIAPAEAMNVNASNALLKCLEEPAGDTLLILVSHAASQVMATIRSRCQLVALPVPTQAQAMGWLSPLTGNVPPQQLLTYANGAPLAALSLLEGEALEFRQEITQGLLALASGEKSPLEGAKQWMSYDALEVIQWLHLHCYHLLITGVSGAVNPLSESMGYLAQQILPQYLHRYIEKLVQLKRQLYDGANPNKQLLLEELLMDWQLLVSSGQRG